MLSGESIHLQGIEKPSVKDCADSTIASAAQDPVPAPENQAQELITIDHVKRLIQGLIQTTKSYAYSSGWDKAFTPDKIAQCEEQLVTAIEILSIGKGAFGMNYSIADQYVAAVFRQSESHNPAFLAQAPIPGTPVTIDQVKRLIQDAIFQLDTLPLHNSALSLAFGPTVEQCKEQYITKLEDIIKAVERLYESTITSTLGYEDFKTLCDGNKLTLLVASAEKQVYVILETKTILRGKTGYSTRSYAHNLMSLQ